MEVERGTESWNGSPEGMTPAESLWEPTTMAAPAVSSPLFQPAALMVEVPAPYAFRADRKQEWCAFENHIRTVTYSFENF